MVNKNQKEKKGTKMWEEGENGQRKSVQGTRERDPNSCRLVQLTTEFIFEKKKKNNKKLGKRKLSYFSFETSQVSK